jgi:hypothetical protein
MRYVYGVYKYGSEDQTLLGLFNFEHEAEKCKIYLNDLGKHAFYEGFYVQEECFYDGLNDYLMDVRSDKLK